MNWKARLELRYRRDGERTTAHDRHEGPLRVLQRLYPEGPGICHHVIVHPPGGIVGGDVLEVDAALAEGCHAVLTTPGATRFYRSAGAPARQAVTLTVAAGARVEWLPLETIAHGGCVAENRLTLALAPGAQAMGWDILALGLPAAKSPFDSGSVLQHLEWPGVWLERGRIDAADTALLDGPLGLAGHRVLATLWFASGDALAPSQREALLGLAREGRAAMPSLAGASSPHSRVVVLRALGQRVEPVMALLAQVRALWRQAVWQLAANAPRIWQT